MENKIYLRFMGGLGNQMFQYAFMRSLIAHGQDAYPNMGWFQQNQNSSLNFVLPEVFPKVIIPMANDNDCKKSRRLQRIHKGINLLCRKEVFYVGEREDAVFEPDVFQRTGGTFDGYWQSERYFKEIEDEIRDTFTFSVKDKTLADFIRKMEQQENTVSVHLRRGDYKGVEDMYGGICTTEYYQRALDDMENHLEHPVFYIFSNDMDWVKENFKGKNFIYITSGMFDTYENWYDMLLMSKCKNNIIANSSFSWWGAWLNSNPNKRVIAPKKWVNTSTTPDKWAEGWIKL